MTYRENEIDRTKWEYHQERIISDDLDKRLQKLGLMGWELVSVCRIDLNNEHNELVEYRVFLKRDIR